MLTTKITKAQFNAACRDVWQELQRQDKMGAPDISTMSSELATMELIKFHSMLIAKARFDDVTGAPVDNIFVKLFLIATAIHMRGAIQLSSYPDK